MTQETIVILDFGSQYTQLIARRVREQHVYAEILPWNAGTEALAALQPKGIILSGGPNSVYDDGAPTVPDHVLEAGVPMLGICYGMQALAQRLGGRVMAGTTREYGPATIFIVRPESPLFAGLPTSLTVWMSHGDHVTELPPGFEVLARSENDVIAAIGNEQRHIYGTQFHPEVRHTPLGEEILRRFLFDICGCQGQWTTEAFIDHAVSQIREQVSGESVIVGLSGGVDSSVVAALTHRAIGDRLTCIFVDTGLLRRDEAKQVQATFRESMGVQLVSVDASEQFFTRLGGITDPEEKRRAIGELFIRIFEAEARRLNGVKFLAQGTIYPDVIESAGTATARRIKSHHNVGGLPSDMDLTLVEPLRDLFKDEVRQVGLALG
ncbi:MAG TPA: glutamine-hydrolyzing GMP synthase, partial [Chloroflexi bacterium]|nr:glutamine-hydrolyzing GMP synthase [Chloroflexota bacterium]